MKRDLSGLLLNIRADEPRELEQQLFDNFTLLRDSLLSYAFTEQFVVVPASSVATRQIDVPLQFTAAFDLMLNLTADDPSTAHGLLVADDGRYVVQGTIGAFATSFTTPPAGKVEVQVYNASPSARSITVHGRLWQRI